MHTRVGECKGLGRKRQRTSHFYVHNVEKGTSILKWAGSAELIQPLHCGQRLRIYPNDAVSASEAFGWYFVVDSTRVGREDEIVDVFVRWRG